MIPILGRLSLRDYLSIIYTFTFFLLERIIRLVLFPVLLFFPKQQRKRDPHEGDVADFTRLASRL